MLNITYTFRNPDKAREFNYLAPSLQKLFYLVSHVLNSMNYDVVVTSMVRLNGTIRNESGVHATGRAIDCIPVSQNPNFKEKEADFHKKMQIVAQCINQMLPRQDGKECVIWHEVPGGGGLHFHIQVPWSKDYKDLAGKIPDTDA